MLKYDIPQKQVKKPVKKKAPAKKKASK